MSTETLQAQCDPTKVVILENPTLEELKREAHKTAVSSVRFRLFGTANGKRNECRKDYERNWPARHENKIDEECEQMHAWFLRAMARFEKDTKPNSEA